MSENLNQGFQQRVINEASTRLTLTRGLALAHYATASLYGNFNYLIGIPNTIIAAIAGGSLLSKSNTDIAGYLSILVAILTALNTFLNPNEKNKLHWNAAITYDIFRIKLKSFIEISSQAQTSPEKLQNDLNVLQDEFHKLRQTLPTVPAWIWVWAFREVSRNQITIYGV